MLSASVHEVMWKGIKECRGDPVRKWEAQYPFGGGVCVVTGRRMH
jgi:hypothetical protein